MKTKLDAPNEPKVTAKGLFIVGVGGGSAHVFVRSGTSWTEQAKLTGDAAPGDAFGISVALSGDTAVVGASGDYTAGTCPVPSGFAGCFAGWAYVFVRNGTNWSEQAKLIASDAASGFNGTEFGTSVALSGDTAVVGAPVVLSYISCCGSGEFTGSASVFLRNGTSWIESLKLTASDAEHGDNHGSVALSGDTAVVGALFDDHEGGTHAGSAYVFQLGPADEDGDGIVDDQDVCADTVIPESVPTNNLGVNRWALVDEDTSFDTTAPPGGGNGPDFEFTVEDTLGCSCEQIIEAWNLGWGHTKFGCSTGIMLQWITTAGDDGSTQPEIQSQPNAGGLQTLDGGGNGPSAPGTNSAGDDGEQRQPFPTRRVAPRRDNREK